MHQQFTLFWLDTFRMNMVDKKDYIFTVGKLFKESDLGCLSLLFDNYNFLSVTIVLQLKMMLTHKVVLYFTYFEWLVFQKRTPPSSLQSR